MLNSFFSRASPKFINKKFEEMVFKLSGDDIFKLWTVADLENMTAGVYEAFGFVAIAIEFGDLLVEAIVDFVVDAGIEYGSGYKGGDDPKNRLE